jgi:hypothetical protein
VTRLPAYSAATVSSQDSYARRRAPNHAFADFGGHGYATVRATPAELETEFV